MKKFEYYVMDVPQAVSDQAGKSYNSMLPRDRLVWQNRMLNAAGARGWELIEVSHKGSDFFAYFKREV